MQLLDQKITETTKSLEMCGSFNSTRIDFKIVRQRSKITHQQRVSRSGSEVTEW